jgi:Flp pilus assembly protein TadG
MTKPNTRRSLKTLLRDREGAMAAEFAMVAPLFLALTFGVATFGTYFAGLIAVTNAAAEGARASVAGLSNSERQQLAATAAGYAFSSYAPFLNATYVTVTSQPVANSTSRYQVSVSYDFTQFGLSGFMTWVPTALQKPTVTVSVQDAGTF